MSFDDALRALYDRSIYIIPMRVPTVRSIPLCTILVLPLSWIFFYIKRKTHNCKEKPNLLFIYWTKYLLYVLYLHTVHTYPHNIYLCWMKLALVVQGLCNTSNTYVHRSHLAAGAKTIIEVSQPHIYIHWTCGVLGSTELSETVTNTHIHNTML